MGRHGERFKDRDHREMKTVVEGVVVAADWDHVGNVTHIQLLSTDEDAYRIENPAMFMDLLQKSVRVSGVVRRDRHGAKVIRIRKCALLEARFGDEALA